MARPIRVEFEGAVYHLTARGNERQRIYRDDEDRKLFLATLEQCIGQHGLRVHGFCLMPNHYHVLLETPRGNLSRAIGWFQTTYTVRFNRRHRRSGHLFQGRFKAHLVEADRYAMELLRYMHLNPVRPRDKNARVPIEYRELLQDYRWSSHRSYLGLDVCPNWLSLDWLSFFGSKRNRAQKEYRRFMDDAFEESIENPWENLKAGLVLGSSEIQERVRDILQLKAGDEELAWVARSDDQSSRKTAANKVAQGQKEICWKVWIRVSLGGERRIDVGRSMGYKDGSAITQILKRLERQLKNQPQWTQHIDLLKGEFDKTLSSVKS